MLYDIRGGIGAARGGGVVDGVALSLDGGFDAGGKGCGGGGEEVGGGE